MSRCLFDIRYEVFRSSIRYLDNFMLHPSMIFGFEKLLMRQPREVRECSSFSLAVQSVLRSRMFFEWHERNIFVAAHSGMDLGTYAYFQNSMKKVIE